MKKSNYDLRVEAADHATSGDMVGNILRDWKKDKVDCEARVREIFKEIEGNWSWVVNPLLGEDFSKRASISYNQWENIKAKYLGAGEADGKEN